jgi:hypothetical protein
MSLHYCVLFLLLIFRCKNLSLDTIVCRKLQTTLLTAVTQSQIYPDLFSPRVHFLRLPHQSHSPRSRSHSLPLLSTSRSSPDLHSRSHSHVSCRYSFFLFFKQILLPFQQNRVVCASLGRSAVAICLQFSAPRPAALTQQYNWVDQYTFHIFFS